MRKTTDRVFNSELVEKWEKYKDRTIHYTLGVDAALDNIKAYCLVRYVEGEVPEIILTKSVFEEPTPTSVKSDFEKEVENLAKYFDANIVGDW